MRHKSINNSIKLNGLVASTSSTSNNKITNAVSHQQNVQRIVSGPVRRPGKGGWTPEEDRLLLEAVKKFNGKNWKRIAENVPNRTATQCLHRYDKVLNPNLNKGPWSKEEDELLVRKVEELGSTVWAQIAPSLPGRIGKQCRERWLNHLDPGIKTTPWTEQEVSILMENHERLGNKWALLSKILPGRSENAIKNYWNSNVKRKLTYSSGESEPGSSGSEAMKEIPNQNNFEIAVRPSSLVEGGSIEAKSANSQPDPFELRNETENGNTDTSVPFSTTSKPSPTTPQQTCEGSNTTQREIGSHRGKEPSNSDSNPKTNCVLNKCKESDMSKPCYLCSKSPEIEAFRKLSLEPISNEEDLGAPKSMEVLNWSSLGSKLPQLEDSSIGSISSHLSLSLLQSQNSETSTTIHSPQFILRRLAMSFKNMPSIMRKRKRSDCPKIGSTSV